MEDKTQVTNKTYDFTLGKEWYVIQKAAEISQDKIKMPTRKGMGEKQTNKKPDILTLGAE